jgi:hypothetical protein
LWNTTDEMVARNARHEIILRFGYWKEHRARRLKITLQKHNHGK